MSSRFDTVLEESLDALERHVPIEEILAHYPEYEAELAPMLEAAMLLGDVHERPSSDARRRSREAFVGGSKEAAAGVLVFDRRRWFQFSPVQAAAGFVVVAGLVGVIALAGRQPTSPQFAGLNAWLVTMPQIANPGNYEVVPPQIELVEEDTPEAPISPTALRGTVEAITETGITVDGFVVIVSDTTIIEGEIRVGSLVVVEGQAQDGRIVAAVIRVLDDEATQVVTEEATAAVLPPPIPTETATPPPPEVTPEVTPEETVEPGDDDGGGEPPDDSGHDDSEPDETDEPDEPDDD